MWGGGRMEDICNGEEPRKSGVICNLWTICINRYESWVSNKKGDGMLFDLKGTNVVIQMF